MCCMKEGGCDGVLKYKVSKIDKMPEIIFIILI